MERKDFPTLITPFLMGDISDLIDRYRAIQGLIDTGQAWGLEGYIGRQAAELIEWGLCVKAEEELTEDHIVQWELEQQEVKKEQYLLLSTLFVVHF